jgi:hypothetical protein
VFEGNKQKKNQFKVINQKYRVPKVFTPFSIIGFFSTALIRLGMESTNLLTSAGDIDSQANLQPPMLHYG